jgi:hypothetical protein
VRLALGLHTGLADLVLDGIQVGLHGRDPRLEALLLLIGGASALIQLLKELRTTAIERPDHAARLSDSAGHDVAQIGLQAGREALKSGGPLNLSW